MSKILRAAALMTAFFTASAFGQEEWIVLTSPASPTRELSGVHFTSANTGYVVGDSGQIYKTTNGGTSWTAQISGVTTALFSVRFVNANVGYITGDSGTILRTTNGGASWVPRPGGTTGPLFAVDFRGPDTGYVVGADTVILRTTNGGAAWTRQLTAPVSRYIFAVRMIDADTAYVAGAGPRIVKTTNGGTAWTDKTPTTSHTQYAMHFTGPRDGYSVGESEILKTTDGGNTWTSQTIGVSWLQGVSFVSPTTGFIVGSDIILKTTNAGASWVEQTRPVNKYLLDVHFADQNTGYAVGVDGTIIKHVYTPPAAPVPTAPAANALNVPIAVNLTWDAVPHTATYRAQVATDSLFASVVFSDSTLLTPTTYVENLAYGTVYYWRVNAKNPGGTSAWSATRKFTTVPPPVPTAPTLVSPANAATGLVGSVALTWNRATHAATYRVQLAFDSSFSSFSLDDSTVTDTTRSASGLFPGVTYYWRVNAKNVSGTSAFSATRRFTNLAAPTAPSLVSPAADTVGVPLSPTLTWAASAGAATYRIQLSTDSAFATTIVNDSTVTGTSRAVGPLANSTVYYWRVNAKNAAGTTSYSNRRKFTTVPPTSLAWAQIVLQGPGVATGSALRFRLPAASHVRVRLYDSKGKLVAALVDDERAAGPHTVPLANHRPGLYLLDFRAGEYRQILKLVR